MCLAAFLALWTFVPAWAETASLSETTPEQELGLVEETRMEFPEDRDVLKFDLERWNRARGYKDRGEDPAEAPAEAEAKPEAPPPPPPEDEPGIDVDLPYDSGLSISGRKLIAVRLKETRRKSAERAQELGVPKVQRDFEMQQELQVRIKGKVGRKITVNVDFDDTQEDKRDISVVYKGDPEEVVQEAAFGDITLSLPSTEFVSYSKQLFGVRTRLKHKRAEFTAIGSRTKGITETKRFSGNTRFERKEILDTAYVRQRYYQLSFDPSHLPLVVGSESIFIDDRNPTNDVSSATLTVEDFAVNASSYTGVFDKMFPGQDYTVDYARGIITFRNAVPAGAVVAADYLFAGGQRLSNLGTAGRLKVLKTEGDQPLADANEVGYRREVKTFYSLGQNRVVRDNGRGNFILKTVDLNRNDTTILLDNAEPLRYPDNLEVDFEAGVFNIENPLRVADDTLYAPSPTHKFSFLVEYRFRLRTYLIKPNIVLGSERVQLNGRLLTRDVDYFIDYDSGFLTFFNEDQIDETTQIEVTYEFAPFGGQLGQTLVGGRVEFDAVPNKLFVGSTFLYTFAPKPTILPDVRSAPSSLMVMEADGRLTDIAVPGLPLRMNLEGEVAQSRENPNLFGKALVDSMEGAKQEDNLVLDIDFWPYASNPSGGVTRPSALALGEEDPPVESINPQNNRTEGQTQRVLAMTYDLSQTAAPVSIVQPISTSGRDFSKKRFLEIWVQGAGTGAGGPDLIIDAGEFNEDADGDGVSDTEDLNLDGTLNLGEDVGYFYTDPGPDGQTGTLDDGAPFKIATQIDNGRIDTEDLDRDGVRDFSDDPVRAQPLFRLSNGATVANGITIIDPVTRLETNETDLGFSGWRRINVPLNITTAEEPNFQAVKQVRVTVTGAGQTGTIRIGQISFVGNRWEPAVSLFGSTVAVSAANNLDDPEYDPLFNNPGYDELYEDDGTERIREQALQLSFDLPAGSSGTTRLVYPTPRDFSRHKALKMFVRAPFSSPIGETLIMRLGSESDYFEIAFPITDAYRSAWILESLTLADVTGDDIPDEVQPLNPSAVVTRVGNPSLTNVGQIVLGVRNDTGAAINDGRIWINDLHLSGVFLKVGNARRLGADFTWDKWGSFGGKMRDIDRNFQTLTSPITNQDQTEESAYGNLTRLNFLPLSFTASRSETVTPAALRTGESGLVSVLEEGRVENQNLSGRGELVIPNMPRVGFGYDKSNSDSNLLNRVDDRDTYTGNVSYAVPWRPDIMPGGRLTFRPLPESFSASYRRTNYFLSFYDRKRREDLANAVGNSTSTKNALFANVTTVEFTDDWSGRMSFAPWNGLNLTPSYSFKTVREERRFSEDELSVAPEFDSTGDYPKSKAQTAGVTASWRILKWFEPRFSYSVSGTETNNLPTVSSPTAFNLKTVDRSSDGEASWTFTVRELMPNFRPTQSLSLNTSYRVQDGDTYDNVEKDNNSWLRNFWLRKPIGLDNPEAARRRLTLRDTVRSSGNWSPFDWIGFRDRWEALKTVSLTATYTHTDEFSETTNTIRETFTTIWPDLIFSMRDLEKIYGLRRWMSNSQMNLRGSVKESETLRVQFTRNTDLGADHRFTLFRRYDLFVSYARSTRLDQNLETNRPNLVGDGSSYSAQLGIVFGDWRITPSYTFRTDQAKDGADKTTQDLTVKTWGVRNRFDKAYPQGLRLPFTNRVFGNINRLIVDGNLTLEQKRSSLNVERDNTDTYNANLTGEYEISRNFRLSFGGGAGLVRNKVKRDDGVLTYEINSQLVIQF